MSLYGSLYTGVSALNAQSQSLAMISNNIANVNTTAYKRVQANFSELVTQNSRTTRYNSGGVTAKQQTTVNQQGSLLQTSSATDISITGAGFFVVRAPGQAGDVFFTRDGSFSEDNQGYLTNSSGFQLMGYRLDAAGNIPSSNSNISNLEQIQVNFLNSQARPTTNARVEVNLTANEVIGAAPPEPRLAADPAPAFTREFQVYDSLGQAQTLRLEFDRIATAPPSTQNRWNIRVTQPNPAPGAGTGAVPAYLTVINTVVEFDGNGRLQIPADGTGTGLSDVNGSTILSATGINWAAGNGANPSNIDIDISSISQFGGGYTVNQITQNGAELGRRTSISIDREGFVTASFSNGQTVKIYKIALATFPNPNGLESRSGNVYNQTVDSGDYNLREAGSGGAGEIASASLEGSNVDLADEFSRMIITQRAYQAGSKVITTADQMLNELLNIR